MILSCQVKGREESFAEEVQTSATDQVCLASRPQLLYQIKYARAWLAVAQLGTPDKDERGMFSRSGDCPKLMWQAAVLRNDAVDRGDICHLANHEHRMRSSPPKWGCIHLWMWSPRTSWRRRTAGSTLARHTEGGTSRPSVCQRVCTGV